MPKIAAAFRIDPELKAKVIEAAQREHRSFSSFIEIALIEKLAREAMQKSQELDAYRAGQLGAPI